MVSQVTKGIKISVLTRFEGVIRRGHEEGFAFSYTVTIFNSRKETVQLLYRHWKIKDALNVPQDVKGEGVIGVKPILKSGEKHVYSSGCLLQSPIGTMEGDYTFVNLDSQTAFKVGIPKFKLNATFAMN